MKTAFNYYYLDLIKLLPSADRLIDGKMMFKRYQIFVVFLIVLMGLSDPCLGKKRFQPSILKRLAPLKKYNLEEMAQHLNLLFYNSGFPLTHKLYKLEDIEDILENTEFSNAIKTIIYCPGYLEPLDAKTTVGVVTAYTKRGYNVIQIDWTYYSSVDYFKEIMPSIPAIGQIYAAAIDQLIRAGLNRNKLNFVGHSLGCQIVGTIGRNLIESAPLVVGLDCAGPGFAENVPHFSKDDGEYTISIHTDSAFYGTALNHAHLDLHVNGGSRFQPGCPYLTVPFSLTPEDLCSHQRSTNIWADIIDHPSDYLAIDCNSFQYLRRKLCDKSNPVIISEDTRGVFGVYHLSTNAAVPYGKGLKGI